MFLQIYNYKIFLAIFVCSEVWNAENKTYRESSMHQIDSKLTVFHFLAIFYVRTPVKFKSLVWITKFYALQLDKLMQTCKIFGISKFQILLGSLLDSLFRPRFFSYTHWHISKVFLIANKRFWSRFHALTVINFNDVGRDFY